MRGYAICTEARSGSTLLCRLLRSTGLLGQPTEFFNVETMQNAWGIADYPLDAEGQIEAITRLGATPNGVYGVKLFSRDAAAHAATRWLERLPSLTLVYLERMDVLGQALSHVRALQTSRWVASSQELTSPQYSHALINGELMRIAEANARWRYFFARNGLPVMHLFYERITQEPQAAVDAIARRIGMSEPVPIDPSQFAQLTVQRDALSDEWRARFIAESRDLTVFP
jgi:LPS sulfotransferase NodH